MKLKDRVDIMIENNIEEEQERFERHLDNNNTDPVPVVVASCLGTLLIVGTAMYVYDRLLINEDNNVTIENNNLAISNTSSLNSEEFEPIIYDIGSQIISFNVDKKELTEYYLNIPDGYSISKIVENSNDNYDIYFINTEKVIAFENSFGDIIDKQKQKSYK